MLSAVTEAICRGGCLGRLFPAWKRYSAGFALGLGRRCRVGLGEWERGALWRMERARK